MFKKISQLFKVKDLRSKILFILGILAIFRLAANVPIPGINAEQLRRFFDNNQL